MTYRYSGLKPYSYEETLPGGYDPRKITDRTFTAHIPQGTIITPLYLDFDSFASFPKPEHYRVFFVMRDPRDIVVSWYFSTRYSHPLLGAMGDWRQELESMPVREGLIYSIDFLEDYGLFAALRSWASAPESDENVLLLRFEEMSGSNNFQVFKRLFSHCDIRMPEKELNQLLQRYKFERLSGREPGEEDKHSLFRKGVPGDWRNYFDDTIMTKFEDATGDLVTCLGYEVHPD